MKTEKWFARCKGLAKMGPFDTQAEAAAAIMTTEGVPAEGAFVWPEVVIVRSRPKQARKTGKTR